MRHLLLAAILGIFSAGKCLAQSWMLGKMDYTSTSHSTGSGSTIPLMSQDRKIYQVFKEINSSGHTFAAFGLTNPGGTGRSGDAIIVRDLNNAVQYDLYTDLMKVFETKRVIRYAMNNSRFTEASTWHHYTTLYNVYAGDYFWYWSE
jgi:hypothetical protein